MDPDDLHEPRIPPPSVGPPRAIGAFDIQERVRQIVEPTVIRAGFDLVAVEWLGGGVLRLSIDAVGGVTIEDCVRVSEDLGPVLDEAEPIATAYHLEVSSPGIERPVQRLADFQRFVGYRIRIKLVSGHPRRNYKGCLVSVDGDEILVAVDNQEHVIRLDTIERAHLVLDLDEYQKLAEGRP